MKVYTIYGLAGQFRVLDETGEKLGTYETLYQAKSVCLKNFAMIEMVNCR